MPDIAVKSSRVGHINLNGDYSQLLPATLDVDADGAVQVRVPYLVGNFPERWWWFSNVQHIGGDGKPIPAQPVPTELDYFDNEGTVGLVGCRTSGQSSMRYSALSAAAGVGGLTASFAVESAVRAANYAAINGFRSEIDGLGQWLNYWAHRTTITLPKDGKPTVISTTLDMPGDLKLTSRLNLCAALIGTAPGGQRPEMRYTSTAFLQTHTKTTRDWSEHLRVHRAVRDLLRVAVWKPLAFQSHQVASDADSLPLGENGRSNRWCTVLTATTGIGEALWADNERPLFVFEDIGTVGVGRWLKLEEACRRGLRPFLRLLDIRSGTIDEHMTQLGIALEAVGYQVFRDAGVSEEKADKKSMAQRVRKILGEVAQALPTPPPSSFPQAFADGYNGVKHASRPEPEFEQQLDLYRTGVRVLRAWIALRVGLPAATVKQRLR